MNLTSGSKQTITKFILDLATFIGVLVALDPRLTGIAIHEWLTIAGTAAILVHLLLNWNWIAGITRQFFKKTAWRARLGYILNWLLFLDGLLIVMSGLMISPIVLPSLGIQLSKSAFWSQLHALTTDWSIFLLGLHVALHWDWIVGVFRRYAIQPLAGLHLRKGAVQDKGNEVQA